MSGRCSFDQASSCPQLRLTANDWYVEDLGQLDHLADRELVVEAIVEDESAKVTLFRRLDEVVTSPDAILASNTSSIPIMSSPW